MEDPDTQELVAAQTDRPTDRANFRPTGHTDRTTAWVNQHHDVEGLCKEMLQRMHDLVYVTKGQSLSK